MGPPDMVYVAKVKEASKLVPGPLRPEPQQGGYYHNLMSIDTSSPANIAAYFGALLAAQPQPTYGKVQAHWKVQRGLFAAYNAFTKRDIRIEFNLPGTVAARVLSPSAEYSEMTDLDWEQVYLSSVVRALNPPYAPVPALKVVTPIQSKADEEQFIRLAGRHLPGAHFLGYSDLTFKADVAHNWLIEAVLNFYLTMERYDDAAAWIEARVEKYPQLHVVLARLAREKSGLDAGLEAVHRGLEVLPQYAPLMWAKTRYLMDKGKQEADAAAAAKAKAEAETAEADKKKDEKPKKDTEVTKEGGGGGDEGGQAEATEGKAVVADDDEEEGGDKKKAEKADEEKEKEVVFEKTDLTEEEELIISTAKAAVDVNPDAGEGWFLLSEALVSVGKLESAVRTLNVAPMAPSLIDIVDTGFNGQTFGTIPHPLNEIDVFPHRGHHDGTDIRWRNLPASQTTKTEGRAYSILVKILHLIGWDNLLGLRSAVFVMDHEAQMARSASQVSVASKTSSTVSNSSASPAPADGTKTPPPNSNPAESEEAAGSLENPEDDKDAKEEGEEVAAEKAETPSAEGGEEDDTKAEAETEEEKEKTEGDGEAAMIEEGNEPEVVPESNSPSESTGVKEDADEKKEEDANEADAIPSPQRSPPPITVATDADGNDLKPSDGNEGHPSSLPMSPTGSTKALVEFITDERKAGPSGLDQKGKRMCERWLDQLFLSLYEDLKAYHRWVAEESATDSLVPRMRADWLRLAECCSRLNYNEDAAKAWRACVNVEWDLRAWMALLRQFLTSENLQDCLVSINYILRHYERFYGQQPPIHPEVTRALYKLVGMFGLSKVRSHLASINGAHSSINTILLDTVVWRTPGYDK